MSEEKKFVDGLFVKVKNAPFWEVTELTFKVDKFKQYLNENQNEKGYVNIEILPKKDGGKYPKLNDWKPKPKEEQPKQQPKEEGDDLPF